MLKSIGGSSKRTRAGTRYNTVSHENPDKSPGGRYLIGKIGIGLFSVAQLTQHFQIISKSAGENFRTSATIKLRTHNEEQLTSNDEHEYVAGHVSISSEPVEKSHIETHGHLYCTVYASSRNQTLTPKQSAVGVSKFDGP